MTQQHNIFVSFLQNSLPLDTCTWSIGTKARNATMVTAHPTTSDLLQSHIHWILHLMHVPKITIAVQHNPNEGYFGFQFASNTFNLKWNCCELRSFIQYSCKISFYYSYRRCSCIRKCGNTSLRWDALVKSQSLTAGSGSAEPQMPVQGWQDILPSPSLSKVPLAGGATYATRLSRVKSPFLWSRAKYIWIKGHL